MLASSSPPCPTSPAPPLQVKFGGGRWAGVSQVAKDCIRAMLEPDPLLRPTASEVLGMAWLQEQVGGGGGKGGKEGITCGRWRC